MQTVQSILADESSHFQDWSGYCRLCWRLPEESQILNLNLILDEKERLTYYECFKICTGTEIYIRDGVPRNLCNSCGLELQMAYRFQKKVEESLKLLSKLEIKNQQREDEKPNIFPEIATISSNYEVETDVEEVTISVENLPPSEHFLVAEDLSAETEIIIEKLDTTEEYEDSEEHIDVEEFHVIEEYADDVFSALRIETYGPVSATQKNLFMKYAETMQLKFISKSCAEELVIETPKKNDNQVECNIQCESDFQSTVKEEIIILDEPDFKSNVKEEVIIKCEEIDQNTLPSQNSTELPKTDQKKRRRHVGKYKCDYCNKEFKNLSRMLDHRVSHEVDRPKYYCDNCGRLYLTKQAMEVHQRSAHNENDYVCNLCGKSFIKPRRLEVHMRYHTGDFPYICDLCGKKFAQQCHLNVHKNVQHNSVRFTCEYPNCGKFFTSSYSLRNHECTHGTMPFECEFCEKGYPSKSKLKVHIRRGHNAEMTLDQLERMRRFHVMRAKLIKKKPLQKDILIRSSELGNSKADDPVPKRTIVKRRRWISVA